MCVHTTLFTYELLTIDCFDISSLKSDSCFPRHKLFRLYLVLQIFVQCIFMYIVYTYTVATVNLNITNKESV